MTQLAVPGQADIDAKKLLVFEEMWRREIPKWPRKIMRCVLLGTLAHRFPRTRMTADGLSQLRAWAGLPDIPATSRGLKWLVEEANMLDVEPWPLTGENEKRKGRAAKMLLGINVLVSAWNVKFTDEWLTDHQELMNLEAEPDLREAMRECFIEKRLSLESGTDVMSAAIAKGHRTEPGDVSAPSEGRIPTSPEIGSPTVWPGGNARPDMGKGSVVKNTTVEEAVRPSTAAKIENLDAATLIQKNTTLWPRENGPNPGVAKNTTVASTTVPGADAMVSPHTPLPKQSEVPKLQLLDELQQGIPDPKSQLQLPATVAKNTTVLTRDEAFGLEQRLRALIGNDDFVSRRMLWVEKMIWNFPNAVATVLDKLPDKIRTGAITIFPNTALDAGRPPGTDHLIKLLVVMIKREAGVIKWKTISPGPEPVE